MSVRFAISLDCEPRRELGPEGLFSRVLLREQALALRRQAQEADPGRADGDIRATLRSVGGDQPEVVEGTIAEFLSDTADLGPLSAHCADCPASMDGHPYGCMANIAFPISAVAEEWITGQLAPFGSRAGALFRESALDRGWGTGTRLPEWRRLGLLERESPVPMAMGEGAPMLTSDALWHALFLLGEISPQHGLGLLLHLQAFSTEDGREGDAIVELFESITDSNSAEEAPMLEFNLLPVSGEDRSIYELKRFLFGVYLSFSLQTPLSVHL